MTTGGEEPGEPNGQKIEDIVRDGDEYYEGLRRRYVNETRLHVAVVGVVVWFAVFAVLGFGAITTVRGAGVYEYLAAAFLVAVVIGVAAGLAMYANRRRRGFRFEEIGALLKKMKEGGASSEDGLHLMDAMHRAALVMKKRSMDSAFEYGVIGFILVALVGENAGSGALAGVITYLYFRFEALREYEKEEKSYEDSKRDLLQSL
ncbi:MAG: hypothetical protein OK474_10050 [Thaumarchaeota archaeon]|nr:hypothetical protein [Nitrososphaerota archaeon]